MTPLGLLGVGISIGPYVASGLVAIALLLWRPPVTGATVVAVVPWAFTAAGIRVYATVAAFPGSVRPLFDAPQVYVATFAVAGVAWIAACELSTARRPPRDPSYNLAAMGAGVALVLVIGTVASASGVALGRLALLPVAVVVAAGVACALYFAFGILYTDVPAYTGLAGGLVVFGHALHGIATALGSSAAPGMGHTFLSSAAVDLAAALPATESLDTSPLDEWVWILLSLKLAFAVLVLAALAGYARSRPTRANVVFGGITAAGVVPGLTTLLFVLTGA